MVSTRCVVVLAIAILWSGQATAQRQHGVDIADADGGSGCAQLNPPDGSQGAFSTALTNAHDALAGKTIQFQPYYIVPHVMIQREFRETEMIESVGTVGRVRKIAYRGNYWCEGIDTGQRCFGVARGRGDSDFFEVETSSRFPACKFEINGPIRILAGMNATDTEARAAREHAGLRAKGVGPLGRDNWQGVKQIPRTFEGSTAAEDFWRMVDSTPKTQPIVVRARPDLAEIVARFFAAVAIASTIRALLDDGGSDGVKDSSDEKCYYRCPAGTSGGPAVCSYPPCRPGQYWGCNASVPALRFCR